MRWADYIGVSGSHGGFSPPSQTPQLTQLRDPWLHGRSHSLCPFVRSTESALLHALLQSRPWVQHLSLLGSSCTALCCSGNCRTKGPSPLRPAMGCCWGMHRGCRALQTPCLLRATQREQ